jgi:membrane protein implicated in regulation of membrane protease activity
VKSEKRRKVTIKTRESEIVITTEDIYAIALAFVAVIIATAAVVLLAQGRLDYAITAFSFLSGMGLTEGVRRAVFRRRNAKRK